MQVVPKPKSFLHFMSLQTGVELICLFTVFNKASGLYGLLALLTGAPISGWQMSMYLYSVVAAVVCGYSLRHIKSGSSATLECLIFAWFYLTDTLINFAYTALFATTWFLVLSQQQGAAGSVSAAMNDTAGFTRPMQTVSSVTVVPTTLPGGGAATALASAQADTVPALGEGVLHPEQLPSIFALVAILCIKVYFILVVFAYARTLVARISVGTLSSYEGGWKAHAYMLLTKGSYWTTEEDLRLSKSRSSRRSDEAER